MPSTLTQVLGADPQRPAGPVLTGSSPAAKTAGDQRSFAIAGSVTQVLSPGVTQPLNLIFTNPFNFDIDVTGVSIGVQSATTKNGLPNPGCNGSQNLVVSRAYRGSVVVGRNSTKSLSELAVPAPQWPLLTMPDLPVNQDACASTTFGLTYQGTAVKP